MPFYDYNIMAQLSPYFENDPPNLCEQFMNIHLFVSLFFKCEDENATCQLAIREREDIKVYAILLLIQWDSAERSVNQ